MNLAAALVGKPAALAKYAGMVNYSQYTNKIRNPRGEGGTVGVIGSGGALPTNWAVEQAMSGVAASFLGAGAAGDGRPYVDIGLAGTLSGANALIIRMEGSTYATASAGQACGLDFGSMLQAGTATGLASIKARIRDSAGVTVAESSENGLSGTATRLQAKGVVSGAARSIYPRIVVDSLNNGATVSATIRIYAPKLVQVAGIEIEKISNPGPFVNTTGWALGDPQVVLSATSGNLKIENGDASAAYGAATIATVVGAVYKVSYNKAVGASAGRVVVRDSGGIFLDTGSAVTGAGVVYFVARQTFTDVLLSNGSEATFGYSSQWSLGSAKLVTPGYLPTFPILPPVGVPGDSTSYAAP